MFPRVALEDGHTWWAPATISFASSVLACGSWTCSSTLSLNPPSPVGCRFTLLSIATSPASTRLRRATTPIAPSKHDA